MMVSISEREDGRIEPTILVFTNKDRTYPIYGVPEDIYGAPYCTGPRGWMDRHMSLWMKEREVTEPFANNHRRIPFVNERNSQSEMEALSVVSHLIRTGYAFPTEKNASDSNA